MAVTMYVMLTATFFDLIFGVQLPAAAGFGRFFSNVIFLNSTHVGFTFAMLLGLPELKKWTTCLSANSLFPFWWKVGLLAMALFVIFLAGGGINHAVDGTMQTKVAHWLTAVALIVPTHHAIQQVKGISYAYNQLLIEANNTSVNKAILRWQKTEARGYSFFLVSVIALYLVTWSQTTPMQPPWPAIQFALLGINISSFLLIIYSALKTPNSLKSSKPMFLIRLLFFPLAGFSFIGLIANEMMHGMEYFSVFKKMSGNSELDNRQKITFLAIFGFIFACFIIGGTLIFLPTLVKLTSVQIMIVSSVYFSLAYTHYYLDRILFRMRDTLTRQTVSPLLLSGNLLPRSSQR